MNSTKKYRKFSHSNHYTRMLYVLVWGRNWILFIHVWFLPPANEVWEGYDFTGVCLSTGGWACMVVVGGAWLQGGIHSCGRVGGMCGCRGHMWLQGACVIAGGCAWWRGIWWDTVNKLAVRIPLECILLSNSSNSSNWNLFILKRETRMPR